MAGEDEEEDEGRGGAWLWGGHREREISVWERNSVTRGYQELPRVTARAGIRDPAFEGKGVTRREEIWGSRFRRVISVFIFS